MPRHRNFNFIPFFLVIIALIGFDPPSIQAAGEPNAITQRALNIIGRDYVDPDRISPRRMLDGALNRIQKTIPEILIKDVGDGALVVVVGMAERRFSLGQMNSPSDLAGVMREIISFIAQNYHGDTPIDEIEYGCIDGMLEVLDPHSNFMPPKVYKEFQVGTRGKFGGLGIVISIKDGQLTVIAPIEGTPASRAGIRAGDRILQISDESTINMSLTDAVNKLRGDVGSKVSIVTERQGRLPRKIELTRAIINIDSVQAGLLTEGDKRIGYLRVKSFQANTDDDVNAALKGFHKNGARLSGLILDLRNNPGGLLDVGVDLADHFLRDGVIVTTVGAHDRILEKEVAREAGTEEGYPIIVLINEGSASAAEIVAGALQANGRAVVMGSRSFGKGSVQTIFEVGKGAALKLTIAQYKPASTQTIQLVGVQPDIELVPAVVDRKAINLIKDITTSEGDLERHLGSGGINEAGAGRDHSLFRLKFLQPWEDEKDIEAKSVRSYQKTPDIENDYAVQLARRLIARAGAPTREAMLGQMSKAIEDAKRDQEALIDRALGTLGVDWSGRKPGGEPRLKLAYRLRKDGKDVPLARAGEKIELVLTTTNVGSGEYSRLIAVGQSDMPFLANREFPFGRIAPGATHSWSSQIEIPQALPRQDLMLDLTFEEAGSHIPSPLSIVIPMDEISPPAFAFSYKLVGGIEGKTLAQPRPVSLSFDITNTGGGPSSPETWATMSNDCGETLFIEKGRTKLGSMPPKTTRQAVFRFHLSGPPTEKPCQLKFNIADTKRFVGISKKFTLDMDAKNIRPLSGIKYEPPVIELTSVERSTAATGTTISGTIRDTDRVRDYFVFVDEKKVAYIPNVKNTNSMPFHLIVPLEPGNNQITIAARDGEDITGRKIIVVERTSGERKKGKKMGDILFVPDVQP